MNFGAEFYINGKFIDSHKESKKYYYLFSQRTEDMISINIGYSNGNEGNCGVTCTIKIGYVDGKIKVKNVNKHEQNEFYDNIPIDLCKVLIVIVYLDCEKAPENDEFNMLYKRELELYYNSDNGYPSDYDYLTDCDAIESGDVYQSLLDSMSKCMISSNNSSSNDYEMN